MADELTSTKGGSVAAKKEADPNAAVQDAYDNLRQALIDSGMDEATADAKLHAVQPPATSLVGNFADLQRLGGAQVNETGGIADAFQPPPAPPTAAAEASAGEVS